MKHQLLTSRTGIFIFNVNFTIQCTFQEKEAKMPKAVRNIYLIRHGQYEIEETEADKRVLTRKSLGHRNEPLFKKNDSIATLLLSS